MNVSEFKISNNINKYIEIYKIVSIYKKLS